MPGFGGASIEITFTQNLTGGGSMYAGMNRRELHALLFLTTLIALGVGARAMLQADAEVGVWIEHDESLANLHANRLWDKPQAKGPLDLNSATAEEIAAALPLVGATRARTIIEHREAIGRFSSAEQILDVPGIGQGIWNRIQGLVYVEAPESTAEEAGDSEILSAFEVVTGQVGLASAAAAPEAATTAAEMVDINSADAGILQTLWNIGPSRAQAIVQYRQNHGPFQKPEDLVKVPGIGPKTLERNFDRLRVR